MSQRTISKPRVENAWQRCELGKVTMCGITGFIDFADQDREGRLGVLARMTSRLAHRGPDDCGYWLDEASGLALGHRRLSVLDLSSRGHQPMASSCGRYVLIYNGEIYNFRELRQTLESSGCGFRGSSDTEVLLEAIAKWGVAEALRRLNGMFALAVWDQQARTLTLARDAVGIKPLYYGWGNSGFLFASELKAIREHPAFRGEINREALTLFLRHGYVPAPHSIYRDIYKLPPGCLLSVSPPARCKDVVPTAWWRLDDVVSQAAAEPFQGSPEEAVAELDRQLREAIRLQMAADVPLGAFLSGGIDSSTVVALMQAQSDRPIRTFTVGFEEQSYNEAVHAQAVAKHLGTDHTECYVTPSEAREVIPQLPELYDEPFADSSQIPTALISRIARRQVTVCLSGDGGDELFGGYDRYGTMQRRWRRIGCWPRGVRSSVAALSRALADRIPGTVVRRKLRTLAEIASLQTPHHLYAEFNTHWRNAKAIVVPDGEAPGWTAGTCAESRAGSPRFSRDDDVSRRRGRICRMIFSSRSIAPAWPWDWRPAFPYWISALWNSPGDCRSGVKVRGGETKWVLRRVLERYVPRRLTDRPKMGFGVPIDAWLRGPLREWTEDLLNADRLGREGFLRPEPIHEKWREHLSGRRNWQYLLWDVLMFQAWLDRASQKPGFCGKAGLL